MLWLQCVAMAIGSLGLRKQPITKSPFVPLCWLPKSWYFSQQTSSLSAISLAFINFASKGRSAGSCDLRGFAWLPFGCWLQQGHEESSQHVSCRLLEDSAVFNVKLTFEATATAVHASRQCFQCLSIAFLVFFFVSFRCSCGSIPWGDTSSVECSRAVVWSQGRSHGLNIDTANDEQAVVKDGSHAFFLALAGLLVVFVLKG